MPLPPQTASPATFHADIPAVPLPASSHSAPATPRGLATRDAPATPAGVAPPPRDVAAPTDVAAPIDAAELSTWLICQHEAVSAMIERALTPLSPLRCTLSPEQAELLTVQLHDTRAAIRRAKLLSGTPTVSWPEDVPGRGGSGDARMSDVAEGSGVRASNGSEGTTLPGSDRGSVGTDRGSVSAEGSARTQASRLSMGEAGRARTGPALLETYMSEEQRKGASLTFAESSDSHAHGGQGTGANNAHYSDKLRQFSRGGSDSKLASQPARMRTLRASLEKMFIQPLFGHRRGGSAKQVSKREAASLSRSLPAAGEPSAAARGPSPVSEMME